LLGIPEGPSLDTVAEVIERLESGLAYELEDTDELEDKRMSEDEMMDYYPKKAGFDPVTGEFRAGYDDIRTKFQAKVMEINKDGTKRVTLRQDLCRAENIEADDHVVLGILDVEKAAAEGDDG